MSSEEGGPSCDNAEAQFARIHNFDMEEKAKPEQLFKLKQKSSPALYAPEIDLTWLILFGLAASTRVWGLATLHHVVFDEVHFGRFTSFILQHKFFFDVHPPLGKLLYGLAGYLSGFDGSFTFSDIGQDLAGHEHYVWYLRLVPALFSSMLVPTIYEIIIELGCSYWFAIFGSILFVFENMLVIQGKFILLDSPLLFFISFSVCCYIKFLKEYSRPFQFHWWMYLVSLGIGVAASVSIKYNGLLTVLLIGGITVYELWLLVGDITVPIRSLLSHLMARVACLVVLPVILYLAQFYILFALLTKSGPHDMMMSSAFQSSLQGGLSSITQHQAGEIAYGSQITLRNTHNKQCWLHSHADLYPIKYPDGRGSSAQQQVTCYAFKDINNWWIVKDPNKDQLKPDFPPRLVKNGDIISLVHGTTGRGLNSHDVAAPLNPHLMEVSGYIDHNVSMDAQFGFRLEILNPDGSGVWKTIHSQIRLVHVNTSASVKVSGGVLPDWGFRQFEVATDRMIATQESIWNVEEHNLNVTLPQGMTEEEGRKVLQHARAHKKVDLPFFEKFWEFQIRMLKANSELTIEHSFASRPTDWPLMKRGIAYWIDKKSNAQIFCIGNPFVWWAGSLAILCYLGILGIYLIRRRRVIYDLSYDDWNLFVIIGYLVVGGYLLNYLPFFPMERTLFIHHYLPSLVFKIALIPLLADHIHKHVLRGLPSLQFLLKACCVTYAVAVVWAFKYFSAFTYGSVALPSSAIVSKKWLSSWDFLSHPGT